MNALEQLTAADPLRDRAPTADEAERMDAAMRRLVADGPARGEMRRGRRTSARPRRGGGLAGPIRVGRSWALVPAAAAALYAAFALGAPEDGPRRFSPAPASAATVLADLSRKVAAAPAQTGRYAYEKRLSYVSHMRPKPGGKGTFVVVLPHEDEQWVAADGTTIIRNVIHFDRPTFPTAEDKADYEAAGNDHPPSDEGPHEVEPIGVAGLSPADIAALPTEPARLRERISSDKDTPVTAVVGRLLATAQTPPKVKAALYEVLKALPGATLVPEAKDPEGRTGVGVEFDEPAWKTLFLFDPDSGALLGTRSIGREEVPGRDIDDWSLVIESGRRDDAPKPSRARTLTRKVA